MKLTTRYFGKASSEHTQAVIKCIKETLSADPDLRFIIVASTQGQTGLAFAEEFKKKRVIVVSHQSGFVAPDTNELSDEMRTRIENTGARVLTATHAFAGVSRGIRKTLGTWTTTELLAVAYRTLGQGTKVCAEISMMAADSGLIPVTEDVVCIGGTGRGADTAWIIRPTYTSSFPELKLRACICKPIDF
jgi:hypothetical protein